jgi:hypothetical protein
MVTENYRKHPDIYNRVGFPMGGRFLGNSMVIEQDHEVW